MKQCSAETATGATPRAIRRTSEGRLAKGKLRCTEFALCQTLVRQPEVGRVVVFAESKPAINDTDVDGLGRAS